MKQIVTVTEVDGEGLDALLGQNVMLFCMNYIYAGKLVGVNDKFVKLENCSIVYETGAFTGSAPGYKGRATASKRRMVRANRRH